MDAESQNFGFAAQAASNSLYDLNSQLRKAQKLSNREAGGALAQEMAALSNQTTVTTESVVKATEWPEKELSSRQKGQRYEITSELERLLSRVREFQSSVTDKLKAQQQKQMNKKTHQNENTPLLHTSGQQQVQVLDQLDQSTVNVHSAIVGDREDEIVEIQRGAHEINAIFQDLGILVSEQGQQLDTVEDNIADLARQTENAGRQLVRAETHQKSRGKWTCFALVILLVITILVALNIVS